MQLQYCFFISSLCINITDVLYTCSYVNDRQIKAVFSALFNFFSCIFFFQLSFYKFGYNLSLYTCRFETDRKEEKNF